MQQSLTDQLDSGKSTSLITTNRKFASNCFTRSFSIVNSKSSQKTSLLRRLSALCQGPSPTSSPMRGMPSRLRPGETAADPGGDQKVEADTTLSLTKRGRVVEKLVKRKSRKSTNHQPLEPWIYIIQHVCHSEPQSGLSSYSTKNRCWFQPGWNKICSWNGKSCQNRNDHQIQIILETFPLVLLDLLSSKYLDKSESLSFKIFKVWFLIWRFFSKKSCFTLGKIDAPGGFPVF